MTLDVENLCWDLAARLLKEEPALDTGERIDELADLIRFSIEHYIKMEKKNYEPFSADH